MANAPVRWVASLYGLTLGAACSPPTMSASSRPLRTIHHPTPACAAPAAKNPPRRIRSAGLTYPLRQKYARGTAKYTPRPRPHILCAYSIQ